MASPVGERDGKGKRPRCVGIFLPAAALGLTAMLAGGCGGAGDPRPKVEAGLQHYFSTLHPEDSVFPYAAGAPRVIHNGCKELHRKFPLPPSVDRVGLSPHDDRRLTLPTKFKNVALWRCFVRFNAFALTVHVAVNDSNEVVWALPWYGDSRKAPKLAPARTYTG